jgi:hypothetical protein
MDFSNGIESRVPLVAIPEHLSFAFEEWIAEQIRRACDSADSPETEAAVIRAVHVRDGFVAGSLRPAQVAEVAEGAAGWLQPHWPKEPGDVGEVERLAAVTRELLELRDHALAVAANNPDIGRVVAVGPDLREVLRSQTLRVLEFNHEPFEDPQYLAPAELLASAAIFRDAIAVLDTIGWLPTAQTATIEVLLTGGHVAQLERLRVDVAMSIVETLNDRAELTESEDTAQPEDSAKFAEAIAAYDEVIAADRLTVAGLLQIIRAATPEPGCSAG